MNDVLTVVVGVGGTVAGVLISTVANQLAARGARHHADKREHRTAAMQAATSLLVALDDHRISMVNTNTAMRAATSLLTALDDHRISMVNTNTAEHTGAGQDVLDAARTRRHQTRAAITRPLVEVKILLPAAAELADRAVSAVYAMRHAPDSAVLEERRAAAAQAAQDLAGAVTELLRQHLAARPRRRFRRRRVTHP